MEALPEATIDVGGGSQSLEIEGLGVKRRKDDLSVTTSSTSQIAIQDLFGDLLDEVNFSDPTSVDAFRDNAANRIVGLDSASINSILGRPSTIAEDTAALGASFASTFADEQSSQNQFRQLFGTPVPPSVEESGSDSDFSDADAGFDFDAAGFGLDVADPVGDPNFGSIAGLGIGALGPGEFDIGAFAAQQAGAAVGVNFGAIQGALNADISNPANAISSVFNAIDATSSIVDIAQRGVSIPDLFSNVEKTLEGVAQSIYNAITNPEQELASFGMNMHYGTQFPDLFQFDLPFGQFNFAFDKVTGKVATPAFIGMMLSMVPTSVMRGTYNFAQGHSSMQRQQDRNRSAIDAFSAPPTLGVNNLAAVNASPTAQVDYDEAGNVTGITGGFGSMEIGGYGAVAFDLGAIADKMGPDDTIATMSFADIQTAGLPGNSIGVGPVNFDEIESLQAEIAETFSQELGMETKADIAQEVEFAQARAEMYSDIMAGIMGIDRDVQQTDEAGLAAELSFGFAGWDKEASAEEKALGMGLFDAMQYDYDFQDPKAELEAIYEDRPLVEALLKNERNIQFELQQRKDAESRALGGQALAMDYNAQAPDPTTVDAMERLGYTHISMNTKEHLDRKAELYDMVEAIKAYNRADIGTAADFGSMEGASGSFGGAFGDMSAAEAQAEYDIDPLSDIDTADASGRGRGFGAVENIGDAEAASDALGTDVTGPGAKGAPEDFTDDMTQADQDAASAEAEAEADAEAEAAASGGPPDCFVQGTPVLMEDGSTKAIEKVVVGDLVAGKDGNANEVKATHIRKPDIPFLYGFNGHKPFVTAYHPFMTKEGWGCFEPEKFKEHRPAAYQELANEQGGKDLIKIKKDCEILRSDNEWALVEDVVVKGCDPNLTVYNLSVANDKTFVANNYIVHNKDSGGGDWVICTELKNQGKLDAELYSVASVYFRNNLSQDTLEGYWAWAISYAERMKHNKLATSLARPLAHGRAVEIAHRIDPSKYPKSSFLGKLTIWLGEPLCSLIGKSIRLFKNKQLVNKRLDYQQDQYQLWK